MPQAECSVDECDRRAKSRGWCSSHLEKWRRYGSPTHVPPRTARLRARVEAGVKACLSCGEVKSFTEFFADAARADGRKDLCKACCTASSARWRERNPEKVDRQRRAWYESRTDAQRLRDLESVADWKRRHPEKVREYIHRRRAAKASSEVGEIDLDALWDLCGGACPDCNAEIRRDAAWGTPEFASLDHIIPLSVGGPHTQGNVRYTCLPCNLRKGATVPSN